MDITLPTKQKTQTTPGSVVNTHSVPVTAHPTTTYEAKTYTDYPRDTFWSGTSTYHEGTVDGEITYITVRPNLAFGGGSDYQVTTSGVGSSKWTATIKYVGSESGITVQINITVGYRVPTTTTVYYGELTATLTNGGTITAVSVSSVSVGTATVEKTSNTTYKIRVDGTSAYTASVGITLSYTITTTILVPDVVFEAAGGTQTSVEHVAFEGKIII